MSEQDHPYVWQMVRDAVEALGTPTTNVAVRDWILERYPGTNKSTIQCQIILCTVNHDSRIHYPGNKKPRRCTTQHDLLFRTDLGKLDQYDPKRHGEWEIAELDDGTLAVRLVDVDPDPKPDSNGGGTFAAEAHLRDCLAMHLEDIEPGLALYVDDNGTDGIEYATKIGRIDVLAVDKSGGLVVIELKVGQSPDAVCGQLLRYTGWIKRHLAEDRKVRGIIIAQRISDRIRYAMADIPNVELKEYELSLELRDAEPLA